jgi:predicted RNA polymerase sigma factor
VSRSAHAARSRAAPAGEHRVDDGGRIAEGWRVLGGSACRSLRGTKDEAGRRSPRLIARHIVRARQRTRDAGPRFGLLAPGRTERFGVVLHVFCLIFKEG